MTLERQPFISKTKNNRWTQCVPGFLLFTIFFFQLLACVNRKARVGGGVFHCLLEHLEHFFFCRVQVFSRWVVAGDWWIWVFGFLFPGISSLIWVSADKRRNQTAVTECWLEFIDSLSAVIYSVWAACLSTVWGILRLFDSATWCWCQWILIKIDFGGARRSISGRRGLWLILIYSLVYLPIFLKQKLFDSY